MSEYPFIQKVREKLEEKNKSIGWLLGEINKGTSWFYTIKSISDLHLKTINEFSKLLDFDFVVDFYKWKGEGIEQADGLNEPVGKYAKQPMITVQITIQGTSTEFTNNFGNVLKVIQKEGEKAGFRIA